MQWRALLCKFICAFIEQQATLHNTQDTTNITLTFATGTAAIGDTIEVIGISATLISVRAFTSTEGGVVVV